MLNGRFIRNDFLSFLHNFFVDFERDVRPIRVSESSLFQSITYLGESTNAEVSVLEIVCDESSANKRVTITQAAFKVLSDHGIRHALVAFHHGGDLWRLSLLTSSLTLKDGKVVRSNNNPRRYSYLLGVGAKTKTPTQMLIAKGEVTTLSDLKDRFSVEVVNREFYTEIANLFTKLVGGERSSTTFPGLLKLNGNKSQGLEHQEFAVRMIGRVIFAWFLKEKKSKAGVPIVPNEIVSSVAVSTFPNYYRTTLEPLFFELLNKRPAQRAERYRQAPFNVVPYLNGGLFTPQRNDYYTGNRPNIVGPGVEIPDDWFRDFFHVLERFNFTVDENTSYNTELSIDPEMLGRIFENLLAEINPETGESARKSTGSYYTPREIADYMVDTLLIDYVGLQTDIDESKVRAVVSWEPNNESKGSLTDQERLKFVRALGSLKILDPACGSGAFPIGLLQKIVYILQQVDPDGRIWLSQQLAEVKSPELRRDIQRKYKHENYDWIRKFGVIRDTIFGVDIQPIATEIARLRCFLTLIIDEDVDDQQENRGIHPLPNLDFKFVTANSLVGLPGDQETRFNTPFDLYEHNGHIEELKDIRSEYFAADPSERVDLQLRFRDLQNEMLKSIIDSKGTATKLYQTLSHWNPFSHDAVGWFDSEWMFGVSEFDLIIANPPYVGEKGHKEIFDPLKDTSLGKRFYKGKMDLFYYFFHLGLDKLKQNGTLAFITTNYYPTADGALKLRKDIYLRADVLKLINFGELTIFDSAKGQHNLITILRRNNNPNDSQLTEQITSVSKGSIKSGNLGGVLTGEDDSVRRTLVTRANLFDDSTSKSYLRFQDGNESLNELFAAFVEKFPRLGSLCNINQGIISGADRFSDAHAREYPEVHAEKGEGIFVFPKGDASGFVSNMSVVKPWFKNSDISQYVTKTDFTQEILYLDGTGEDDAGAVSYLERFKPILQNRREFRNGKRPWFTLHRARSEAIFNGEKIVAPQRSHVNTFAYNNQAWYASADVYFITPKSGVEFEPLYLLGVLNSSLIFKWLYHRGKRKGEMLELYKTPLTEIPIAQPPSELKHSIIKLVQKVISLKENNPEADVNSVQTEINLLVLDAYGVIGDLAREL